MAAARTASSSTGFILQVEYTTRPPTLSIWSARTRILTCVRWSPSPLLGVHLVHTSRFFLVVPSPEQGTSARMRSNLRYRFGPGFPSCDCTEGNLMDGNIVASWFVTMMFGELKRFI